MEHPAKESNKEEKPITIDYDRIDVSQIMGQIKRKAAEGGPGEKPDRFARAAQPSFPTSQAESANRPAPGRIRGLLLKLTSPLRPLIKLLILPVYEEHRQAVEILDQTNRRLDRLYLIVEEKQGAVISELREYTKLLHELSHNLVVETTKLKIEVDTLRTRVLVLEKDFESLGRREKALEQEFLK